MQKEMFIVGYYFNPRSGYAFNVFQKAVLKLARKLWTAEHITKGLDYLGPVKFGPVGEVAGTVSIYKGFHECRTSLQKTAQRLLAFEDLSEAKRFVKNVGDGSIHLNDTIKKIIKTYEEQED